MVSLELLPYQEEGVQEIAGFGGRALLADDMGLGKTCQALTYLHRTGSLPALVVTRASCKINWEREAGMWAKGRRCIVLSGEKPPAKGALTSHDIYVINYEILGKWEDYLGHLGLAAVVFDECQDLCNMTAQRTKAAKALARKASSVLALSGSPFLNRPSELYSVLNMVRPDVYKSFTAYAEKFCAPRLRPWGWEYKGATNLPTLHRELKQHCMIRRLKKDVLKDLPDKVRRVVPLQLGPEQAAEYRKANDRFMVWLKEQAKAGAVHNAKKAQKLTQTGELLRLAARHKLRAVVGWVNQFLEDTDEKIIVFGEHQAAIEVLQRRLGGNPLVINGNTPTNQRQGIVDLYQRDPTRRVLVGSKAAGTGLNITAATACAFAELWWRPSDHTQAEDRLYRIGQRCPVWCYYLVAAGTIEERMCALIQAKQATVDSVMDGTGTASQVDVFDQLISEMEQHNASQAF